MSLGNVSRKWVREKMSPGNGFRKWVQEKISFTDSSFTDAISQGNAQMYGPNAPFILFYFLILKKKIHLNSNICTVATHRFGPVSEVVPNRLIVADQGCSLSHF